MKTILITGASAGVGRALAVRAARAGYSVYAVGRNTNALNALATQIGEEGGVVATDACDIANPAHAGGLIGRALGTFGRIDILVNNAGAAAAGPLATQSDNDNWVQFGTHVLGPLALVREALPSLRAAHGHVFMVGSGLARIPVGGMGAYPASKAALRSATATLRRELHPLDIAVTYVDPGAVDTQFMRRAGMPGASPEVLVSPEQVARKILLAIASRPRVVNVAPFQAAAVALADLFPRLTEFVLERNPAIVGAAMPLPGLEIKPAEALPPPQLSLNAPLHVESVPLEHDAVDTIETIDDLEEFDELDRASIAAWEAELPPEPDVEPEPEPEPDAELEPEPGPESDVDLEAELNAVLAAQLPDPVAEPEPEPLALVVEELENEDIPAGMLPVSAADLQETDVEATSEFDAALEPLHRRMERAHLDPEFIRGLLVLEAVIDVSEVAMRWAGMPNKHERALTSEVFFALAEWGFLAPRSDGRYRVVRTPDSRSFPL